MDWMQSAWFWWALALALFALEALAPGAFMLWLGFAAAAAGLVQLLFPDLGLVPPGAAVLAGPDLDALDEAALAQAVRTTAVYARVAPVSFVVAHHVKDGRRHLNFSEWAGYSAERKAKKLEECGKEVSEGKMPMTSYVLLHPEAQLTDAEKKSLAAWAAGAVND